MWHHQVPGTLMYDVGFFFYVFKKPELDHQTSTSTSPPPSLQLHRPQQVMVPFSAPFLPVLSFSLFSFAFFIR
ncbi:hypothetical protein Scep_009938 [Stephania cephalantha]|uniref:Uncharacterized protein n=1 Tax=Stephania cephalantha TaxID=152367 RepID=A0AAP0PDL3_9MAGN